MRRQNLCSVCLLAFGLATTSLSASSPAAPADQLVSAIDVKISIRDRGPAATVRLLRMHRERDWKRLISFIDAGNSEWIALVPALHQGTDASTGEDLAYALSVALTKSAEPVLKALGTDFPPNKICSAPYIEPSESQITTYLREALRQVRSVEKPALEAVKKDCLRSLEEEGRDRPH